MKKVIAAINMTLDGFCDHTSGVPDEEVHQHYADLLRSAGTVLYGRITYQLMEFWRTVLENPTGEKAMDDFAVAIDNTLFDQLFQKCNNRKRQIQIHCLIKFYYLSLHQQYPFCIP